MTMTTQPLSHTICAQEDKCHALALHSSLHLVQVEGTRHTDDRFWTERWNGASRVTCSQSSERDRDIHGAAVPFHLITI